MAWHHFSRHGNRRDVSLGVRPSRGEPEGVQDVLRGFLADYADTHRDLACAIFTSPPNQPSFWSLAWASQECGVQELQATLGPAPTVLEWAGGKNALGLALFSAWQPLAFVVWSLSETDQQDALQQTLEACRERYLAEAESRWMRTLTGLLGGLQEQRREIGAAIHRGPAQALTAARLELSMLSATASEGPLGQALTAASEGLVEIVHGKLRDRHKTAGLRESVRAELEFQARWRDLPTSEKTLTLASGGLSEALANLWKLSGGVVQEGPKWSTFRFSGDPG